MVKLAGITRPDNCEKWPPEATEYLVKFMNLQTVLRMVINSTASKPISVVLIEQSTCQSADISSINYQLVENKHAESTGNL